ALFDFGDSGRDADDDSRTHPCAPAKRLLNELAKEIFRLLEIRDHAVFERTNRDDLIGRAPEHALRFFTDRDDLVRRAIHGNHRGLVQNDPFATQVDEGVGCPEVDRHVVGEDTHHLVEKHPCLPKSLGGHGGLLPYPNPGGPESFLVWSARTVTNRARGAQGVSPRETALTGRHTGVSVPPEHPSATRQWEVSTMKRPNLRLLGFLTPMALAASLAQANPPGSSPPPDSSPQITPYSDRSKIEEYRSIGVDRQLTAFTGTVLDVAEHPIPGVEVKLFVDGQPIASTRTDGSGGYQLQAPYDPAADVTVLLWFTAPDHALMQKELVLKESKASLENGLISRCVPRAAVLLGRQFRVYLF